MEISEALFKQWIVQHHESVYRHAFWMTSNIDLAKDLVQDTYYQAWKHRTSLHDEKKVLPWLLTILRRIVYKEYQHPNRKLTSLDTLVELDLVATTPNENIDEMIDLERELNSLSMSQREILLLYALHGFTYDEISEQLEIPTGTVMSRLSRARKAMNDIPKKRRVKNEPNVIQIQNHNRLRNNGDK